MSQIKEEMSGNEIAIFFGYCLQNMLQTTS